MADDARQMPVEDEEPEPMREDAAAPASASASTPIRKKRLTLRPQRAQRAEIWADLMESVSGAIVQAHTALRARPPQIFVSKKVMFKAALESLRELYVRQHDPDAIRDYVARREGLMIRMRNPAQCYLILRSGDNIPQLKDRRFSRYLCCYEKLTAIGVLGIRTAEPKEVEELPCAVLMGPVGRTYAYDWDTDGLILLTGNFARLADTGLRRCEPVYRSPHLPLLTTEPRLIVRSMVGSSQLGASFLNRTIRSFVNADVALETPQWQTSCLRLAGSVRVMRKLLPFSLMTEAEIRSLERYLDKTFRCRWYPVGCIGEYVRGGLFDTESVVLTDAFGAIYAMRVHDTEVIRLADDVPMFFKIGLCKLNDSIRFDRNHRGQGRLEDRPGCPHHEIAQWERTVRYDAGAVDKFSLSATLDWMMMWPDIKRADTRWRSVSDKILTACVAMGLEQVVPPGELTVTPARATRNRWRDEDEEAPFGSQFRCPIAPRDNEHTCWDGAPGDEDPELDDADEAHRCPREIGNEIDGTTFRDDGRGDRHFNYDSSEEGGSNTDGEDDAGDVADWESEDRGFDDVPLSEPGTPGPEEMGSPEPPAPEKEDAPKRDDPSPFTERDVEKSRIMAAIKLKRLGRRRKAPYIPDPFLWKPCERCDARDKAARAGESETGSKDPPAEDRAAPPEKLKSS